MWSVEIFLPLADNQGARFPAALFAAEREVLVERFGGLTAFTRAPADGIWRDGADRAEDDIVIFDVLAGQLDPDWWRRYREHLERVFHQDAILIKATKIDRL